MLALTFAGLLVTGIVLSPPAEPPVNPSASPPPSIPEPAPPEPSAPPPAQPSLPSSDTARSSETCPEGCASEKPGCEIKGNISFKTGERIYHLPGQMYYGRAIISPEQGERWFCTEEEAAANGWRRAKV